VLSIALIRQILSFSLLRLCPSLARGRADTRAKLLSRKGKDESGDLVRDLS
jgi:hypothetical protein